MELMIVLFLIIISILAALVWAFVLHKQNEKLFLSCNRFLSNDYVDDILISQITLLSDDKFNYVYSYDDLPLGRVSAFLNYFGRNVYDEEPYAYYCKRSSRDNEFREYGCVIARTGVYISTENPGNKNLKDKDNTVLKASEKHINFSGLTNVFCIGSCLITVNYMPGMIFDKYRVYSIDDGLLRDQIP